MRSLLDLGVIEQSKSPWATTIVTVKKKDGSLRLFIDYRRLNEITTPDPYQMPRTDDLIDHLENANYISTLDMAKGYY